MGTLGQTLRSAREKRSIDLRDAAQQTRISFTYLKALEEEDFSRLPGEVFVKGFLKNYGKFLCLDEFELLKRYGELRPSRSVPVAVADKEPTVAGIEKASRRSTTIEPFLWGTGILIALVLFVFTALPDRHKQEKQKDAMLVSPGITVTAPLQLQQKDKLYLEVVALENTWLLVRTDNSPQKKALLNKDESLTWSADERFLLSYGSAKAIRLTLNGRELVVNEPGNAVVRDLAIIASGIVNRNIVPEKKLQRKAGPPAEQVQQPQDQQLFGLRQPAATPKPQKTPFFGPPASPR